MYLTTPRPLGIRPGCAGLARDVRGPAIDPDRSTGPPKVSDRVDAVLDADQR